MVTTMTFDELKEKALNLPLVPGVYIMKDKVDEVIRLALKGMVK